MKATGYRVIYFAFSALLLAALTACGGGGGYGGGGGGGGTVYTYTVGGMVSGLTVSGLVLRDNGGENSDDIQVSASGAFTFAGKIATGAAYGVSIYKQPTNPAETCVVANGSGTMGSSNVTNVAVSCTLNGFTGFVGGSYHFTDIESDFASSGTDLLDGSGGFGGSYVKNTGGAITSGTFLPGTYTAAVGGAMTLAGVDGGVSADGNTIVFASLQATAIAYVDVEIKQCSTSCTFTNADFSGAYQVVSITSKGDLSRSLTLTADGVGGYIGTAVQNNNSGVITSGAISGTYSVAADGSLTVTPASGSPLSGGISADGKTLVLSQLTAGQPGELAVGVKQGQSAFTNADVVGTYKIVDYANLGNSALMLTLYFDGTGLFNGSATANDSGAISDFALTGTYTVAADGTLTVSPADGSSFTGGVSADGNTLVFTDTTAVDSPAADVGVRL